MVRGPLFQDDYRPLFSGHETFPLRYGWLKKAVDAISTGQHAGNRAAFLDDSAIARLGVGKNMVGSIRHWATFCGVIEEGSNSDELRVTPIGELYFGSGGLDRFMEDRGTMWLLHWMLCAGATQARAIKTTWFWVFNHYPNSTFKRDDLVEGLMKLADARGWRRVSRTTVQRDVECFVRTYETKPAGAHGAAEDTLESPLAELGLLRGLKGHFQLIRGPKPSLPAGVFAYALYMFWDQQRSTRSLNFETIAHEPGSPGRVFLLDEADLTDRLANLEDVTRGAVRWSETAGLKQVFFERALNESEMIALLRSDHGSRAAKEAA
jgi:hypothetical protein